MEQQDLKFYKCSVCGKNGIKLWRPYGDINPLICATCAEKRQSKRMYQVLKWEKSTEGFLGTPTGEKKKTPKWKVDDLGRVPANYGPGPDGKWNVMTDQLSVNLKSVSENYASGETTMIPAVPIEEGKYWSYTAVPKKDCEWWDNLPTR